MIDNTRNKNNTHNNCHNLFIFHANNNNTVYKSWIVYVNIYFVSFAFFVRFACVYRSLVFRFSVPLRLVRVIDSFVSCIVRFVYHSFRSSV